jgi:hypothetical protein
MWWGEREEKRERETKKKKKERKRSGAKDTLNFLPLGPTS